MYLAASHRAYEAEEQHVLHNPRPLRTLPLPPESSHLRPNSESDSQSDSTATISSLHELRYALSAMQEQYFSLWLGKWTSAIDWTAAVMSTYVSATLSSLSRSSDCALLQRHDESGNCDAGAHILEDEINKYFGQSIASYYGEETFSIRMQAFDDQLWVVLEWLESIKFIELHSSAHHTPKNKKQAHWHAQQFISTFAHRARVFYELAEKGWDWRLCGGGLTWNPRLLPYKNAITNQLFISASINMYLHFPGDENCSPVLSAQDSTRSILNEKQDLHRVTCDANKGSNRGRHNPIFRQNAINGYDWPKNIGMLNEQGLYTDGFHIRDYRWNKSATTCNERNEMVYTYNQGVILSGLRGLWEATGNTTYLLDGYELVTNVVRATGYCRKHKQNVVLNEPGRNKWHGLGSNGILTEVCDLSGSCNQDGQTFKGIFYHHLTAFCEPLPLVPMTPGSTHAASEEEEVLHQNMCHRYTAWVVHNAKAALKTRDSTGRFGSWWGAPDSSKSTSVVHALPDVTSPGSAIDYRNSPSLLSSLDIDDAINIHVSTQHSRTDQDARPAGLDGDPNDRGRGRTVETQGSGLAVVRAMYEFQKLGRRRATVLR
jgi:hypothetical protein